MRSESAISSGVRAAKYAAGSGGRSLGATPALRNAAACLSQARSSDRLFVDSEVVMAFFCRFVSAYSRSFRVSAFKDRVGTCVSRTTAPSIGRPSTSTSPFARTYAQSTSGRRSSHRTSPSVNRSMTGQCSAGTWRPGSFHWLTAPLLMPPK
jgi:hypothetical protein